jgi:hypothetical protein
MLELVPSLGGETWLSFCATVGILPAAYRGFGKLPDFVFCNDFAACGLK